jgi:translation initiation factor 2 beta subunit (eIF-2beta)/eIF-5
MWLGKETGLGEQLNFVWVLNQKFQKKLIQKWLFKYIDIFLSFYLCI